MPTNIGSYTDARWIGVSHQTVWLGPAGATGPPYGLGALSCVLVREARGVGGDMGHITTPSPKPLCGSKMQQVSLLLRAGGAGGRVWLRTPDQMVHGYAQRTEECRGIHRDPGAHITNTTPE